MANKDQKRSNKETRKPKQEKVKPAVATSTFISIPGQNGPAKAGKRK